MAKEVVGSADKYLLVVFLVQCDVVVVAQWLTQSSSNFGQVIQAPHVTTRSAESCALGDVDLGHSHFTAFTEASSEENTQLA